MLILPHSAIGIPPYPPPQYLDQQHLHISAQQDSNYHLTLSSLRSPSSLGSHASPAPQEYYAPLALQYLKKIVSQQKNEQCHDAR